MRASLLFCRKLGRGLEEFGFVVNPYDPCVVNKDVGNGEQMTIIWHINNLMASCTLDFEQTTVLLFGQDLQTKIKNARWEEA